MHKRANGEPRYVEVLLACDGREGVNIFEEHADEIDVVLLDMTMPHMGGEEAFVEMSKIRHDVKVILSSGFNEADAMSTLEGKSLAGFIQKPYRPSALIELLGKVVSLQEVG